MRLPRVRTFLILAVLCSSTSFASAQASKPPLKDRELIALVSGGALSENIVYEIGSRGLAFHPNDAYRALLTTAGADATVLAVLNGAKTDDKAKGAEINGNDQLLQSLATAGKLIRAKQFAGAASSLRDALQLQFNGGVEAGFVMAESLRRQEHWEEAAALYSEVLRRAPNFPEVQTKLSFLSYRLGDPEAALRETKAALDQNPRDAEAHKNAGLALQGMQKFSASEAEYQEALRIKPNYGAVYDDLGLTLFYEGKLDQAIVEYKKAITLEPDESGDHIDLGVAYERKGDFDSAIREDRDAKRLDPTSLLARQNLGNALVARGMAAQAVLELRELEAMAPESSVCHNCLGKALFQTWDFAGAEKEYRKALELSPNDADPHVGLGHIKEMQKDYDAALAEYRLAERIDISYAPAYEGAGRVLLTKKDLPTAVAELQRAVALDPSDVNVHDLYGQALEMSGNHPAAITEFKQAVALDPKQTQIRLRLADALEKNANSVDALDQYRQASAADPTPDTQSRYKAAQERLKTNVASLKATGNSKEAAALETSVRAAQTTPGISEKLNADMQAGFQAMSAQHFDEAETSCKEAVDLAEKLQPHDGRLTTSLICMANIYAWKKDFPQVEATLQRALKTTQEMYGADSPMTAQPLQALGGYRLSTHDYDGALDFFQRAVDVNEKTFGESSDKVADSLRVLSNVYVEQKDYEKAETYLLRAVHINDALFGKNISALAAAPQWYLCVLYDKWSKPEKAEPCYEKVLGVQEAQYGANSPLLLTALTNEAQALHQLGRADEAAKVEERSQSIRTAMAAPNN